MQAIENESRTVAYVTMRKLLYPGKCGYAMETGGIMHDIRSLTVEQIRQYHKDYYRPDNTFIIVTGMVAVDKGKPLPWHICTHAFFGTATRQPTGCATVRGTLACNQPADPELSFLTLSPFPPCLPASLPPCLPACLLPPYLYLPVLSAVDKLKLKMGDASRHPPPASLPRPFFTHPVPPLTESVDKAIEFPADEEDSGCVMVAWRGKGFTDFSHTVALNILHAYLTESEVSILHRLFVEGEGGEEEGACAAVSCGLCENGETFHYVSFDSVRTAAIDTIQQRLVAVLGDLCEKGLDMTRMATVLDRFHVRHLNSLEDSPHDTLAHYMTLSILFADRPQDAANKLSSVFSEEALASFKAYSSDDWVALLKETMLEPPMVCVRAVPSAARAKQLEEEEEARVEARVKELGEQGLEELQRALDEAVEANETPVPDEVLEAFQVPSVDSISFINMSTAVFPASARAARLAQTEVALNHFHEQLGSKITRGAGGASAGCDLLSRELAEMCAGKEGEVSEGNLASLPVYVQLDDVPSDFVEIRVVLNTAPLSQQHRAYLELYLEACFSLPVRRRTVDGSEERTEIGWEAVVQELQDHLVHYGNSLGFGGGNFACGAFSQVVVFSLKSQGGVARYSKAVQLAREVLCDSVFTHERLAIAANNLLNDIPETKREGEFVAQSGLREKLYRKDGSNHRACNLVRQQRFLSKLVARLESEPASVVEEMEAMRAALVSPGAIMMQVIGNMRQMAASGTHPLYPIVKAFPAANPVPTVTQPGNVRLSRELHSPAVAAPDGVCPVLPMAAIESCFLYSAAEGLPSFQHKDTAPMLVATELLTCIEGPMWNLIRGLGLAYSFTMYGDADEGLCYFSLSRSPAVSKAFAEAGKLVAAFGSGEKELTPMALENAIASVMSSVVSRESTFGQCGLQSLMTAMRRSGPGHNARLLKAIAAVTAEQVLHVINTYLLRLFSPASANVFVTCSPSKLDEVCSGMAELSWRVEKLASLEAAVEE